MVGSKFLSPRNDLAFKKIFGTEKNQDILIHFLNDIIQRPSPISQLTFLKTTQEPEIAALRLSIVDVLCQDQQGDRFIIEMQLSHKKGFDKRALYYAAKTYCAQGLRKEEGTQEDDEHKEEVHNKKGKKGKKTARRKGAIYADLKDVYFLAITAFTPFPQKKHWLTRIGLQDLQTNEHDIKGIQLLFLQLPLFNDTLEQLQTISQKWAYFLKHAEETSEEELQKIIGDDVIIQRAYEELNRYNWTEEELRDYESIQMKIADELAALATAKEEGEKIGFEKGEKLGIEKTALAMQHQKLPIELIATVTGLSPANLRKLFAKYEGKA